MDLRRACVGVTNVACTADDGGGGAFFAASIAAAVALFKRSVNADDGSLMCTAILPVLLPSNKRRNATGAACNPPSTISSRACNRPSRR